MCSYYINPPGSTVADCVWGTSSKPVGNWAPYVAGANTDSNGETFVKIGWNPIYTGSSLMSTLPTFGVKIECPDGGCNGLPCSISPNSSGNVDSNESAVGAGGASFCVVTVPKGGTANIVTFNTDGSSGSGSDSGSSSSAEPSSTVAELKAGGFAAQAEKATSTTAAASSTEASTTAPASTEASTTAAASSTAAESTTAQSSEATTGATSGASETDASTTTKASKTASYAHARPSVNPGMFHENGTSSQTTAAPSGPSQTQGDSAPVTTTTKKGEAGRQQGSPAFAGLIVAFVAAACFF